MMILKCKECQDVLMRVIWANSFDDIMGISVNETLTLDCQGHKDGDMAVCKKCGFDFGGIMHKRKYWERE